MSKPLPPVEFLRECLAYDPDTGELRWKHRPREHFITEHEWSRWNTRYAEKIAGRFLNGYFDVRVRRHRFKSHRLIWKLITSDEPPATIDHANGNTTDNRWSNLRAASKLEQNWNAGLQKNNTSGYCGVYQVGSGRYGAHIRIDRAYQYLGTFDTPQEASAVRENAARKLHGSFYRGAQK